MNDAANVGVLRDVFLLGMGALVLGLAVYGWIRSKTGRSWNNEGNVLVRPYDSGDGVIAILLLSFFGSSLLQGLPQPVSGGGKAAGSIESITVLLINETFMLGVGISIILYLRLFRGLSPAEMFGLRQLRPGKALVVAFAWLIGAIAAIFILEHFLHGVQIDDTPQQPVQEFRNGNPAFRLLLGASAVVVAPLAEETIFRGFLYGVTKRFTDRWFAAIFTSVMFAVVHGNVGSLFPLFVLAMGLSLAYETTGCLLVPVLMHAMFNALNIFELVLE